MLAYLFPTLPGHYRTGIFPADLQAQKVKLQLTQFWQRAGLEAGRPGGLGQGMHFP